MDLRYHLSERILSAKILSMESSMHKRTLCKKMTRIAVFGLLLSFLTSLTAFADGTHQTGWRKIDGTWYYLAPSGAMMTGWQK
ncbi:hypothetical protein ACTQ56_00965 [[Clostridium] aminophilum]|uniref:hypothetical protein n=1 Tax=[Clostridium] aminophilum TaxID=1526 RepID=UPI003F968390